MGAGAVAAVGHGAEVFGRLPRTRSHSTGVGVRVFGGGEVDHRGVDIGAAVDHRVGVAGVGEDRVVAGAGEVFVGALVAEQLVWAGVAEQQRRPVRSPRGPRSRSASRALLPPQPGSPAAPNLPTCAGVEASVDASAVRRAAPRRRCRALRRRSSVSPSQIEIERKRSLPSPPSSWSGPPLWSRASSRPSAESVSLLGAGAVDEQVFAAFAAGQVSLPSPPSRTTAGLLREAVGGEVCRRRPCRRGRSSRAAPIGQVAGSRR